MNRNSNSATFETGRTSESDSAISTYNGPVCSKCSAPDEGYAICRVCGYYPKLGSYVEVDYKMEGLVEEEKPAGFQLPTWANTAIAINLVIIAESAAVSFMLPLDSSSRMAWSLLHLIGGAMTILAFQFRGTVWAIMDDTSVTAVDCIVWPPRAWEAVAVRLPESSRHFIGATVGLIAVLMSLLVLRSVPYSSPFAIDEESQPKKPKSVVSQVMSQAKPKAGQPKESMEDSLNSFAEDAGAKDAAAGKGSAKEDEKQKSKEEAEMKAALEQVVPEDQLQGPEQVVHTARSIIVGYFSSDSNPNEVSSVVVATASRFNNSRSKFEILGSVSVQGTPQAEQLMNRLRGTERAQPFVESHISAVWVEPKVRCEIDFNEHGANRQPVNLKLKSLF